MTTTLKTGVLAAAVALVGGAAAASTVTSLTIDTFETNQQVGAPPILLSVPSSNQVDGTGILGDFRDMEAVGYQSGGNFLATDGTVSGGILSFSNDAGAAGALTVTYDGDDDPTGVDTDGLGGIDVTHAGAFTGFAFELLSADLAGLEISMTVWDMDGHVSTLDRTIDVPVNTPRDEFFSFAAFTGTAAFSNLGAIQFELTGPQEIDVRFDSIAATTPVPLPAALPLLLAGFGGLALVKRRQRAG